MLSAARETSEELLTPSEGTGGEGQCERDEVLASRLDSHASATTSTAHQQEYSKAQHALGESVGPIICYSHINVGHLM